MAGRYAGELFVRVEGDRDAAPAYLPAARLLMGEVLEQAGFNELGTHKLSRQLKDGAVLVAEKIGALNRVTIAPPPPGGPKRPVRVFDDLVVTAGVHEWDDAGEMVFPPVILSHDDQVRWRAYFASSSAPGYSDAGGTYGDAFTLANNNADSLRAGNCAYTNGVTVSWRGQPMFLAEPARNPNASYGNEVFCVGRVLFRTTHPDAEQAGNYAHVLAAAIDEGHLLVLVAALEPLLFAPRPATPERNWDAWASPMFSGIPHPTALFRFALKSETDPVTFQSYYRADYGSEELLWSGDLVRGYNRWTFDPDQHAFVSVQLPANEMLLYRNSTLGDPGPSQSLSDDEVIFRVSAGGLNTELAGDVVFESAGQQVRFELAGADADYVTPSRRIPALRRTHDAANDTITYTGIMYADPANDRYVLCHRRYVAVAATHQRTEVRWYSVIDAGDDAPFGDTWQKVEGVGFLSDYTAAFSAYLADWATAGSGIARVCHSACGYIGGQLMMILGSPINGLWQSGYSAYGVRAGAMSYTDPALDILGAAPQWNYTEYYGTGLDTGPQYDLSMTAVLSNWAAASSEHYLAAHTPVAGSYITNGDLPALLNGAFADFMFYLAPLGKPLNTQQRERPA